MPYGEWLTAMPPTSLNAGKKIVYFSLNFPWQNYASKHASIFPPKTP